MAYSRYQVNFHGNVPIYRERTVGIVRVVQGSQTCQHLHLPAVLLVTTMLRAAWAKQVRLLIAYSCSMQSQISLLVDLSSIEVGPADARLHTFGVICSLKQDLKLPIRVSSAQRSSSVCGSACVAATGLSSLQMIERSRHGMGHARWLQSGGLW